MDITSSLEYPPMSFSVRNNSHSPLYSNFLNSCSYLKDLQRFHARILTHGGFSQCLIPLVTKFISLASMFGPSMDYARRLFNTTSQRDPFSWNALIRGYSVMGPCHEALLLYRDMHLSGFSPDQFTFPFVVRSCTVLSAMREGKEVHCNLVKNGFNTDFYIQTALVTMYSTSGEIFDAELVFRKMVVKNVVSWTSMIAGYAHNGLHSEALGVFRSMVLSGVHPNSITVTSILPSVAYLGLSDSGESVHGYAIKQGLDSHLNLLNALIAMYGRCGKVGASRALFDWMKGRDLVSWNAMIASYEQNGDCRMAIELFRFMQCKQIGFNHITVVSVISACGKLGDIDIGRWVHDLIRCHGLEANDSISNALLDMYAKCGSIDLARDVFDKLPKRSVISWSAMIGAYAILGLGEDALDLFHKMKLEGVRPNSFTFTSVMSACSRAGLVKEGIKQFDSMKRDYLITPNVEHCTCIVDLLGRAGRLINALKFIRKMPVKPDSGVWGAFLSACRVHGDLELAKVAAKHLVQLGSQSLTHYVLMSNIYSEAGRWEDAERLRKLMRDQELRKAPGHSLLEITK